MTDRRELAIRLEEIAMKDELTEIANRRSFMQKIQDEFMRANRYLTPLTILMLDTDNFKSINDTYGHAAGDQVLRRVAIVFGEYLRETDFPGRLGGDEFGIILPNTGLDDALQLAERLRAILAKQRVEMHNNIIQFTMSIGVAEFQGKNDSLDNLFRRADISLYQAKNDGRNQVSYK